ncbi:DUF6603 domain-containing protein [Angustibacter sp. McL0619]|uniref:DUF6603 domain-containing protein n=1 Tax=Angustibacter sp. McL0619 TaxID=3415676 RepID=UPI003CF2E729
MTLTEDSLGSFGALARGIGLVTDSGPNSSWFNDPVGGSSSNPNGLKTVLSSDAQRDALVSFVDDVLGPPDQHAEDDVRWIPLFAETNPHIIVSVVLQPVAGAVRVGVGVEHVAGSGAPQVTTRLHVPIFHVPREGTDSRPTDSDLPQWLLIGRPGGRIGVEVDAQFDAGPPTPGDAFLGGASVSLAIPTTANDDAEFSLTLRDLQLPGATAPTTRTLDITSLDEIGPDVLEFVVGIVRQQIDSLDLTDPVYRHIRGLAGILGLHDVPNLPPLPIGDLPTEGLRAIVSWIESVLADDEDGGALDAWLGELAVLVGGAPVPDRNAVEFRIGPSHLLLGLRVSPGAGGHPVLVPWVELTWSPSTGADLVASVDLLRADTATGHVTAVPALTAGAVFGAQATGGSALLGGAPGVGSARIGLRLDEHQRPAFALTLHDVDLPGGRHHELLDLSSPDAALDAATSIIDDALAAALDGFGDVGILLEQLFGIDPPAGVAALQASALIADPLAALQQYWLGLLNDADAMGTVLGTLGHLLTGTAGSAGNQGTPEHPWVIDIVAGVGLRFWREDQVLVAALGADVLTPLPGDLAVATRADVVLLRADLGAGHLSFACGASAQVVLQPAADTPMDLDLAVATIHFSGVGVRAHWSPSVGLQAVVLGDGLTVSYMDPRSQAPALHPIPLPTFAADGSVTFAPDWDALEGIVTALLRGIGSPFVQTLLDLLGWTGQGAHLRLSALVTDPGDAVAAWATEVALDCANLQTALGPVAWLLSGGSRTGPIGDGRPERPYRCPVASAPNAPGLTAWTVPGCPPARSLASAGPDLSDLRDGGLTPDAAGIATSLSGAARSLPDLADLFVGRDRLDGGIGSLLNRWTGTDGVVAAPSILPPDVTSLVLQGYSYAELVASGRLHSHVLDSVTQPLDAVVHVGSATDWLTGQPAGQCIDATISTPATVPTTADGTWYVRLPTPAAAAASRSDHDAVAAQAARLAAVLAARTAPIVVVAYGATGAAAIRAAATQPQVSAVVTVAVPWSTVSLLALTGGLGGDALRLLDRLVPDPLPQINEALTAYGASALMRGWSLVRHSLETAVPADLPSAAGEPRRPGLAVYAVFGALSDSDAARAVAALVVAGVDARQAAAHLAASTSSGPPQELHVAVDVPMLELDIGGLFVGMGAAVDLVSVNATNPHVRPLREVVATLRFGVSDGWLVGGPGASQSDLELRWLEARIHLPLDGRAGSSQLILHEARAYSAYRERWVVTAAPVGDEVTALPEIKILLSELTTRLLADAPDVAHLLSLLGILRSSGLDGGVLDQLLFDPVATLRPLVAARAVELAGALRTLIGLPTTGLAPTAFRAGTSDVHVDIDLATGSIAGAATLTMVGLPPVTVALTVTAADVSASCAFGTIDPDAGGLSLVGLASRAGASLAIQHRPPGGSTTESVGLYPAVDPSGLATLAQSGLPAIVLQAVAGWCRQEASETGLALLDAALDAIGLLGAPRANGSRAVVLPYGLIQDPGQWLRLRADPFGAVVALLEALTPVVVPDRPTGVQGWPLSDELTITYAVVAGRLDLAASLALSTTIDGRAIATSVTAGLSVSVDVVVRPLVDASVTVDQTGLRLGVAPAVTFDLVRAVPATPIRIFPAGAGLGAAIGAAAESAVRVVLNALVDHRTDGGTSLVKSVGAAIHELGDGLGLLETDHFTDARIAGFAENPASALLDRMPQIVTSGVTALAQALDPSQTKVRVMPASAGRRRITFGAVPHLHIDLDGAGPAVEFGCDIELFAAGHVSMGHLVVERLRLTPTGLQVDLRGGPFVVDLGSMKLFPLVVARAGVTSTGFSRLIGLGVGLDPAGRESLEFRWGLDALPPYVASVSRDVLGAETAVHTEVDAVALKILGVAVSLASSVLTAQLGSVITSRATNMLQDVVFIGGDQTLDPTFLTDLVRPEALLVRLQTLAWNCATDPNHGAAPARPVSVTIAGKVVIGLSAVDVGGGEQHVGLNVSLPPGTMFDFPTSDVQVAMEVDASWVVPHVNPGLSILLLKGPDPAHLELVPGFVVGGIGMRFRKPSGPLLQLGSIAVDGIRFSVYAECDALGVGGGAKIQLDGFALAPGGAGSNPMASNIMKDVGSASANNRPAFSPSVAVQKHPGPGQQLGLTLRAGDPPGPWWIVIQRQLGPLYVDRIGFNSVESGGRVTQISLLFSGQLSMFGLSAAVDELGITWNGGDVLSISSWSVDLMGLAISANLAGASLAGGLLKTVEDGVNSYVGMLIGKFGTYGLSVFGGYSSDNHGHASFFLFGGINGPIGGPPCFFLTGVGGGLGINRGLVIPTDLSKFGNYPFIQALDPGAKAPANPMDELHKLSTYFPHQMGNFWFAAGISFTCFSLVDGVAVIAVSFGKGLDINLLGLARLALPRPGVAIVSIELGLLAHFSTSEGLFMIKAQLTDNSWLLYQEVRLTGGFVFCFWWKGPLAGQFVVSMGGYHPSFHREGYPDVPRLGIMWRIGDYLVIKGGTYFALTSEAVMAGLGVEASLDLGWVWAKIAFGADGIVYFDPFWYEVSAFARISAGIHLDLGLFSISMSLTLGATIKAWGPDFAGHAELEIGPSTVPFDFGSERLVAGVLLLWNEFVGKYLEDGGDAARALSAITGRGSLPTSTGGQNGAPSSDGSEQLPFRVFAEFEITFTTTVPTSTVDVGPGATVDVPTTIAGQPALLGLSPMGSSHLDSTLSIRLDWYNPATKAYQPMDSGLARLVEGFGSGGDRPGYSRDAYPIGVWGSPKDPSVPVKPLPSGDVISAAKQVRLVAGVDMPGVGPDIDYHQVRAARRPLPLLATGDEREVFLNTAGSLPSVDAATAAEALTFAADQLFADRSAVAGPPTARGGHSALAKAAFLQDRSAPPIFGTLTDGLAKANGQSGTRKELPGADPFQPRALRTPFVTGFLTSGVGAALRPAATTVRDGRLKRRPAPTVESVHGRLALHVPAMLLRTPAPGAATAGTLVAGVTPPRTEAPGSMRSHEAGPVGTSSLQTLVAGLGTPTSKGRRRRAIAAAPGTDTSTVRSGDVLVLQLPDAALDVDPDRRPSVAVSGKARVTVILGRTVLHDDDVLDAAVPIPHGATHVAVQADGDADARDGWAGWHDRTRVARIGAQSALAAGCVLSADAVGSRIMRWDTAGAMVAGAREVTTRFSRPVSTVAVALSGATASSLTPTLLHLVGARVATDRAGRELRPVAVSLGDTSVLVYSLVPDVNATGVAVTVAGGADWVVSGVVGTDQPAAEVARRIARSRLSGVTSKVLALAGPGCRLTWRAASSRRAKRRS